MSNLRPSASLVATLGLTFALSAFFVSTAWSAEEVQEPAKVHKVVVRCEGEDCTHHLAEGAHGITVTDDGHVWHVSGDEIKSWVSANGDGIQAFHVKAKGGFLGVHLTELTPELRQHFGVPEGSGVMVSKVVEDSPAARAGVEVGDIIAAVDGTAVGSSGALAQSVRARKAGEQVGLEVWRNGQPRNLVAAVEEREAPALEHAFRHHVVIKCGEGEDCDFQPGSELKFRAECGGAEDCKVLVTCDNGDCQCTINGETSDCSLLGLPHHK